MAKMSDDDLLKHLQTNEDDASQYVGVIAQSRLDSMQEYNREPYPDDVNLDGWSTIVTSEVQDTVEWILPELLDVFTSSDEAVVFEPNRPQDVQGAEQATDTCNYVFYKQNNGFLTLYTAFKDALTVKNCAVMWRQEVEQVRETQQADGVPAEALVLAEQEGWEIEAAEPLMGAQEPMYRVKLARTTDKRKIKVEAFPPEHLIVKRGWTSPLLAECPYVARMMEVTLSDLRQMGFKGVTASDLRSSDEPWSQGMEESYRQQRTGGEDFDEEVDNQDESLATGWLRIEFVQVDVDGDGVAERYIIHRLAQKILSKEETDHVQIATSSPILNTHRWDGMSLAEVVSDLQKLKTDLTRAMVNAANLSVNQRKMVLTDSNGAPYANVDDLLDYRIGGLLRTSRLDAVTIEQTQFNGNQMLPVLAYIDDMKDSRTGTSKQQQGLDANALRPDRTAAEVSMTANAAKQRIKLIARIFAETLVKPIFQGLLKLLTNGDMQPLAFRLRGQFVQYDPNEWRDQYDMTINVGLGTGDKQQQMGHFNSIMQMLMGLSQTPYGQMLVDPQKVFNTAAKLVELSGQKNVGDFVNDPKGQPLPPPSPPPQLAIEQAKLQQQGQIKQMEMQYKEHTDSLEREQQAQLELIRQRAQQETDANRRAMEMQMHMLKLKQEGELNALRAQYEDERHQRDLAFQWQKAQLDIAGKIKVADIASETNEQDAATQAATDEIGREVRP